MSVGSHFRCPLSVKLLDGTVIQIVDSSGNVTGGIAPTSITGDTLVTVANKLQFRAVGNYINSGATGKISIVGSGGGADDINLTAAAGGGVTLTGTLAVSSTTTLSDDTTLPTNKKIIFRSSGIFINSPAVGKLGINATVAGADDITLTGGTTITGTLAVSGAVALAAAVTMATNVKVLFRDTATFINSPSAGKLAITATAAGADDITITGSVTLTGALAVSGAIAGTTTIIATVGVQSAAVARTATAGGGTTGTIAANTRVVAVTCDTNTKAITLPTPTPGVHITLLPAGTAYKLQSSTPASVAINGGTGASATSTIAAGSTAIAICTSATTWVVDLIAADGTQSAAAAAA